MHKIWAIGGIAYVLGNEPAVVAAACGRRSPSSDNGRPGRDRPVVARDAISADGAAEALGRGGTRRGRCRRPPTRGGIRSHEHGIGRSKVAGEGGVPHILPGPPEFDR
jgi:hypothetical protein